MSGSAAARWSTRDSKAPGAANERASYSPACHDRLARRPRARHICARRASDGRKGPRTTSGVGVHVVPGLQLDTLHRGHVKRCSRRSTWAPTSAHSTTSGVVTNTVRVHTSTSYVGHLRRAAQLDRARAFTPTPFVPVPPSILSCAARRFEQVQIQSVHGNA